MSATETMPDNSQRSEDLRSSLRQLPSERDWAVYQAVRIEQWPTRAVAAELGISQTRVCQLVQRTAEFIAQSVPVVSKEDEPRQLAAGKQFLYGEAIHCFRMSQAPEKSDCSNQRAHCGDVRYLHAAARLAIMASTLPPPQLHAAEVEQPEVEQPEVEQPEVEQPEVAANEAQETCSAPAAEQPATTSAGKATSGTTAAAVVGCVEQAAKSTARVQTPARLVQQRRGHYPYATTGG